MFYCFIHNWYSTDAPCPVCHPPQTFTTTTADSTEPLPPQPTKLFTTEDGASKFKVEDPITYAHKIAEKEIQKSKPQEQRIEVIDYEFDVEEKWFRVVFNREIKITPAQVRQLKQAIEQVLNDDKPFHYSWQVADYFGRNGEKLFTQQQVDELCEKAALGFMHYTEHIMDDDDWMIENDELKSMSQVYQEFTQWKNKKQ